MAKAVRPTAAAAREAFRQAIREHIRGLCAVPKSVRRDWLDELFKDGPGIETVSPDDFVVRGVLCNLDVFEDVANARREQRRPKVHPLAGRLQGHDGRPRHAKPRDPQRAG